MHTGNQIIRRKIQMHLAGFIPPTDDHLGLFQGDSLGLIILNDINLQHSPQLAQPALPSSMLIRRVVHEISLSSSQK